MGVSRPMRRSLMVADTQAALEALGRAARERTAAVIVAVTGSVGKTGTKEALRRAFERQGRTAASAGSLNNQWGVPLSLARMPRETAFGVFEIGHEPPRRDRRPVAAGAPRHRGDHHGRAGASRLLRLGRGDRRRQGRNLQRHERARRRHPQSRQSRISRASPRRPQARGHRAHLGLRRACRLRGAPDRLPPLRDGERGDGVGDGRDRRLLRRDSRPPLGDEQPRGAGGGEGRRRRCRRGRGGARHDRADGGPRPAPQDPDSPAAPPNSSTRATTRAPRRCAPPSPCSAPTRRARAGGASRCWATCSSSGRTHRGFTPSWRNRCSMPGVDLVFTVGAACARCTTRCRSGAAAPIARPPPRWPSFCPSASAPATSSRSRARTARACARSSRGSRAAPAAVAVKG